MKMAKRDQTVTRGCPEPSSFGTGIPSDKARAPGADRVGDRFGPHRALLILRSLDHKDPSGQVLNGPTLAKARERPDLQATASAADPLDFCSLVDLCFLCYSMLPCDCDCRGCCGCRMFCWRVECCCCCCRAVAVAVVVVVVLCIFS